MRVVGARLNRHTIHVDLVRRVPHRQVIHAAARARLGRPAVCVDHVALGGRWDGDRGSLVGD